MSLLNPILPTLERTPAVMLALLAGLSDEAARTNYGPGTWCAYEVLGHLIVGEQIDWMPRVRCILEHGITRAFDPFPHNATIKPDSGRSLANLLDAFASLRVTNLAALRSLNLTPAHLALRGRHPALGEVTMAQLLATWAAHDLHHIRQACLALVWPLREHVGPWRAYINTFDR